MRVLRGVGWQPKISTRLARAEQSARVRIARDEVRRTRDLSRTIDALEHDLVSLVAQLAAQLLAKRGCGVLTAAKLLGGEIAGIHRFQASANVIALITAETVS